MDRLKIAVAGAGLIAQVEHIPNLLAAPERFAVVGVYDPSATTRRFITDRYGIAGFENLDRMLSSVQAEALLIASPDFHHGQIAGKALDAGLHVFCEKPLCYGTGEIDELIRKRDSAKRVLQIGYMKRFDPSYDLLLQEIVGLGSKLRFVGVEVNDPDAWPFVSHHATFKAEDVPASLIAEGKALQAAQVEKAIGHKLSGALLQGFTGAYSSSLIHDLNLVNGILDHLGLTNRTALSGSFFSQGQGGSAVIAINGDQARCHLAHVAVPQLAEYTERVSLFFEDRRFDLLFPSPYLNHQQTRLLSYRSADHHLQVTEHRNSFNEAFRLELDGFWSAIRQGTPVRNTAEAARGDMQLVADLTKLAIAAADGGA
jgi:predicted dehydrogenase